MIHSFDGIQSQGVAQLGSASVLGTGGHRFESYYPELRFRICWISAEEALLPGPAKLAEVEPLPKSLERFSWEFRGKEEEDVSLLS